MTTLSSAEKQGLWAARFSLLVGVVLLVIKFIAFLITSSQSIFSDAMESIVNVVAGVLALSLFRISRKPADEDHPYGHGKAEFFSATFEGGMITIAATWIAIQSITALVNGVELQKLDVGLILIIGAGLVNLGVGIYLIRIGKKAKSATLEASGKHLITDFYTSLGILIGLTVVWLSGIYWLDPLVALIVSLHLFWMGFKIVKENINALMDGEDPELLKHFQDALDKNQTPGIIQIHYVRIIRSGQYHHIDAHVVIPEFWDVNRAHEETQQFESEVMSHYPYPGEIHFHLDPCRRVYCKFCSLPACAVRTEAFQKELKPSLASLISPTEPHDTSQIQETET